MVIFDILIYSRSHINSGRESTHVDKGSSESDTTKIRTRANWVVKPAGHVPRHSDSMRYVIK